MDLVRLACIRILVNRAIVRYDFQEARHEGSHNLCLIGFGHRRCRSVVILTLDVCVCDHLARTSATECCISVSSKPVARRQKRLAPTTKRSEEIAANCLNIILFHFRRLEIFKQRFKGTQ